MGRIITVCRGEVVVIVVVAVAGPVVGVVPAGAGRLAAVLVGMAAIVGGPASRGCDGCEPGQHRCEHRKRCEDGAPDMHVQEDKQAGQRNEHGSCAGHQRRPGHLGVGAPAVGPGQHDERADHGSNEREGGQEVDQAQGDELVEDGRVRPGLAQRGVRAERVGTHDDQDDDADR